MARDKKTKAFSIAALEVGALSLFFCSAFAAAPHARQARAPAQAEAGAQHEAAPQHETVPQPLDLRPPSHALEADYAAAKSPGAFASTAPRLNGARETLDLPALGPDGMRARPTVQEFVDRARREGLPVARLFETKSALLHLGLSPRGKPGLWLVEKTR